MKGIILLVSILFLFTGCGQEDEGKEKKKIHPNEEADQLQGDDLGQTNSSTTPESENQETDETESSTDDEEEEDEDDDEDGDDEDDESSNNPLAGLLSGAGGLDMGMLQGMLGGAGGLDASAIQGLLGGGGAGGLDMGMLQGLLGANGGNLDASQLQTLLQSFSQKDDD